MYKYGNRYQSNLLPPSIEEYVSQVDSVRAYDAFVESLNLKKLGIQWDENQVGNSEYDPKAMIKLLIYGYSYGIRSSRKLERAINHNVAFMWLMGGLNPDHKTIANFRKNNKKALKNILKQCAQLCIKLNLIEGNTLFVDGSKIKANASISNTWTKEKCEKYLVNIEERIETILNECDKIDDKEQDDLCLGKMSEELKDQQVLKSKVQDIIKEIEKEQLKSINSVDSECVKVKGRQGTYAGYNGQIVVDKKHGLIVNSDVVNENNDYNQFANQIEQANETLEKKCETACADAGYFSTDDLKKIDDENINIIVPSSKQSSEKKIQLFDKEQFQYNEKENCYECPEGHKLLYSYYSTKKNHKIYRFSNSSTCFSCKHFGICTNAKRSRTINRLANEDVKIKLEKKYLENESQKIYKLRKQKVELPFGHIKRNLGVSSFLLRGLAGAKAEMSLFSSCFNIVRMITIFGVAGFIEKIMNV